MNRLLSSLLILAALFVSAGAKAQSASSTVAQPAAVDPWATAAPASEEASKDYNTGWMSAPGMSLSLHDKPSTDYNGRPIKAKAKARRARTNVGEMPTEEMPAYYSGIMVAPGMSMTANERPSTDYWGRPLRQPVRRSNSTLGTQPTSLEPVGASASADSW
ncbi:hypothetical protein [Hymenobacter jejuensis]|uniref:Uncharacterized protein n=1 Tax=Hymenobacter jejuensis TaxID=2502781 RepID=A0A5B8A124_9BACT|nr:hypothetical protein [Hymenobacter jejuensis]QDA60426.1 hypothetical protein FHG12_10030 [Hymenobacter jejuensis]